MEKQQEEKKKDEIVLPTSPRKASAEVPRHMVIYGKPKSGKTTAVSLLKNALIIDVEDGSAFINGMILNPPEGVGPYTRYMWLKNLAKKLKAEGKPYDFVILDTLSQMDVESEWVGTRRFMSSIAGKNFNRKLDDKQQVIYENGKAVELKPDDPDYESVHSMGKGYGYRYSRDAMFDLIDELKDSAKICTIFICHVADKMLGEKNGEIVMTKDLALTGKVRDWVPRTLDCIANVWNEEGQFMISFQGNEDKIGGMRGAGHLKNYSGPLDWNKIFLQDVTIK